MAVRSHGNCGSLILIIVSTLVCEWLCIRIQTSYKYHRFCMVDISYLKLPLPPTLYITVTYAVKLTFQHQCGLYCSHRVASAHKSTYSSIPALSSVYQILEGEVAIWFNSFSQVTVSHSNPDVSHRTLDEIRRARGSWVDALHSEAIAHSIGVAPGVIAGRNAVNECSVCTIEVRALLHTSMSTYCMSSSCYSYQWI